MQFRLTHILAILTITLGAGLVSVRLLRDGNDPGKGPGVVLLDLPGVTARALADAALRWDRATVERVSAPAGPLQPMGVDGMARFASWCNVTTLITLERETEPPVSDSVWGQVLPRARVVTDEAEALRALARFVRNRDGDAGFLGVVALGEQPVEDVVALLEPVVEAVEALPAARCTTVVVLGGWEPSANPTVDGWRMVLRLDRGGQPDVAVADLLQGEW